MQRYMLTTSNFSFHPTPIAAILLLAVRAFIESNYLLKTLITLIIRGLMNLYMRNPKTAIISTKTVGNIAPNV